ncbi:MAG: peptidylprolyl isomerase [Candidatus Acidiferrales bacterium]|jgi:peptidyl-prolyl cis-trans isomerase SurA
MENRNFAFFASACCSLILLASPVVWGQSSGSQGAVIEQIVARVNNEIITLSDYQKAAVGLREEVQQDCQNCTPDQIQTELRDRLKNLLRDMIDQQLLIERAKDMDVNVETDLVKRLDQVRKDNNLATMEELEKAVESQGIVWEDYKTQLRNGLLTQEVIRKEVGGRMDIGSDEVKKYYEAHKQDFNRPEQVELGELFLNTEGKSPEEIAAVRTKAEDLHNRVVKGDDFNELAKRYSQGQTAQEGGDLGVFQRGQLAKQLEDAAFTLDKGGVTDVIQTKTGFEILKVFDHYQAGLQPLEKVSNEITNIIYKQRMEPAMRDYLAELREESYVQVKPGFTDTAAVAGATVIQEVAPTPDAPDKKKNKKKLPLPKASGS